MHSAHLFDGKPRFVVLTYSEVETQSASWTSRHLNDDIPPDYRLHTFRRSAHGALEIVLERQD